MLLATVRRIKVPMPWNWIWDSSRRHVRPWATLRLVSWEIGGEPRRLESIPMESIHPWHPPGEGPWEYVSTLIDDWPHLGGHYET